MGMARSVLVQQSDARVGRGRLKGELLAGPGAEIAVAEHGMRKLI
jgi:hypothetical protein